MIVRRERPGDASAIAEVHRRAFSGHDGGEPAEVELVAALRSSSEWLPKLSLVAVEEEQVVGHVVCTRGWVSSQRTAALGLGPIGVDPSRQRRGIGSALLHGVVAAAEALDEWLIVLLGDGAYYHHFGFEPAARHGVTPPDPEWEPHFHVRPLIRLDASFRGVFQYAPAFELV